MGDQHTSLIPRLCPYKLSLGSRRTDVEVVANEEEGVSCVVAEVGDVVVELLLPNLLFAMDFFVGDAFVSYADRFWVISHTLAVPSAEDDAHNTACVLVPLLELIDMPPLLPPEVVVGANEREDTARL